VLLYTHVFHPSVGGSETAAWLLAEGLTKRGLEVVVVTRTPSGDNSQTYPFRVVRCPAILELLSLVRWAEVVLHSNISLRCYLPLLIHRRPWIVIHHSRITRADGSIGWRDRLKLRLIRSAQNLAVSEAMVRYLGTPCQVIYNPYDDATFRHHPDVPRTKDLVFLGRLVPDKGADVLLTSLARLCGRGLKPSLTIVGDGPESGKLNTLAQQLGVAAQVTFAGTLKDAALARLLNAHRVMVVPSQLEEPFGLVSLEGMACGCVVVGSRAGGLPEAIGPAGPSFPKGDADALASVLQRLLGDPALMERYCQLGQRHLPRFQRQTIIDSYLAVIEQAVAVGNGRAA
jgi:glycosyltransferase involved in cell wall biosynthesis